MNKRVTIRDIAAEAGVHFTTVGLALRNSVRISKDTRERIQKIAERMGYEPDPMLAALNAYRRTRATPQYKASIAWLNSWPKRSQLYEIKEFSMYHKGATERAKELGYEISEFWLNEDGVLASSLPRILRARNIKAALVAPQATAGVQMNFDFNGISAVSLSYSLDTPALHVVTNHHSRSMRLLLSQLNKLGYNRIGYALASELNEKVGLNWLGGMLIHQQVSLKNTEIIPLHDYTEEPDKLLEKIRQMKLDVIISHGALYRKLLKLGAKIPEEFGFANISVDRDQYEVSGIDQNSYYIGQKAVDLVVAMTLRNETGIPEMPTHTLIDSTWHAGQTLTKLKKINTTTEPKSAQNTTGRT